MFSKIETIMKNNCLFVILIVFFLSSFSGYCQNPTITFVSYTYDAAGNRIAAVSSPGSPEAKSAVLPPHTSNQTTIDDTPDKAKVNSSSSVKSPMQEQVYATEDKKERSQSPKKKRI
jgi:hypothetical protein